MSSHKQRAMDLYEAAGWEIGSSEWHDPISRKSYDLFGIIDFLIFKGIVTGGIQATADGDVARRVKKCLESKMLDVLLRSGWPVEVCGIRNTPTRDGTPAVCRYFELSEDGKTIHAFEGSKVLTL